MSIDTMPATTDIAPPSRRQGETYDPRVCTVDGPNSLKHPDLFSHLAAHAAIETWLVGQKGREEAGQLGETARARTQARRIGLTACNAMITGYMGHGGQLVPMARTRPEPLTTPLTSPDKPSTHVHIHPSAYSDTSS